MPVDLNDPKMAGFVPLHEDWAKDCPDVASRRIRDESHALEDPDGVGLLANFPEHADDLAAGLAGLPIGKFYRTGSILKIRVS